MDRNNSPLSDIPVCKCLSSSWARRLRRAARGGVCMVAGREGAGNHQRHLQLRMHLVLAVVPLQRICTTPRASCSGRADGRCIFEWPASPDPGVSVNYPKSVADWIAPHRGLSSNMKCPSNLPGGSGESIGSAAASAGHRPLHDRGCGEESSEPYAEAQHQPVQGFESEQSIALHDRWHHGPLTLTEKYLPLL